MTWPSPSISASRIISSTSSSVNFSPKFVITWRNSAAEMYPLPSLSNTLNKTCKLYQDYTWDLGDLEVEITVFLQIYLTVLWNKVIFDRKNGLLCTLSISINTLCQIETKKNLGNSLRKLFYVKLVCPEMRGYTWIKPRVIIEINLFNVVYVILLRAAHGDLILRVGLAYTWR